MCNLDVWPSLPDRGLYSSRHNRHFSIMFYGDWHCLLRFHIPGDYEPLVSGHRGRATGCPEGIFRLAQEGARLYPGRGFAGCGRRGDEKCNGQDRVTDGNSSLLVLALLLCTDELTRTYSGDEIGSDKCRIQLWQMEWRRREGDRRAPQGPGVSNEYWIFLFNSAQIIHMSSGGFDSFPRLMTRYQKERANQVFKSSQGAVTAITLVDHQTAAANINDIEEIAGDTEIIRQLISRRRDLEERYNVRCEDVFVNLRSSTSELRDALTRSIGAVQNAISVVNTCRWRESRHLAKFSMAEKELDDAVEHLRLCLDEYKHDKRYFMLQPFIPLLQAVDDASRDGDAFEAEAERRGLPLRSLIIACVYASNLVVSSDASIELLDLVRETCHKRRKARLWAPSKLRQIAHWLMRREKTDTDQIGDEDDPSELEQEEAKKTAPYSMHLPSYGVDLIIHRKSLELDPDSRPPENVFQKFMDRLHNIYLWLSSAEGIVSTGFASL